MVGAPGSGPVVGGGATGVGPDSVVAFPEGTLAPRLETGDRVLIVAGAALGGDAMLHAPRTGDVVKIERRISASPYWAPQFIGGLRPTG